MNTLFTVGHSTHPIENFIGLLKRHRVTALADVRSHPYSRHFPQFSKDALKRALIANGVSYVFLGKELGARSDNPACYRNGRADYELISKEPSFLAGLNRLKAGLLTNQIAIMCAEKDPLECHRAILVGRQMTLHNTDVVHILADGKTESHGSLEDRMLALLKMSGEDMFRTQQEILDDAYRLHGEKIAYQDEAMMQDESQTVS